jgi:type IV pilus assembly protein PilN
MRLKINLATRPYRDVRLFLETWGTATALLAVLTLGLCWYTFHAWHQTRYSRAQISQVQSEIDKLDSQRQTGIALLNQPQNREIAERSGFLNGLIARRSFSWTQLFMVLERIMPARLHVTSIAPSLNKNNEIEIHMVVGGDARDQALELVRRLEDSPSFKQSELRSESLAQNTPGAAGAGDRVQFDISMVYVPQATAEPADADKGPQQQAEKNDKAVKPGSEMNKGVNPSAGNQEKALTPSAVKMKKSERAAQARPVAPTAAAAGRKGVAQ